MSLEKEPLLNGDQLIHERPPAYSASTTPVLQTAPEPNDVHVQYRYGAQQMENPPNTCMIPAVMACLCCCWPLGLAAILKASETAPQPNDVHVQFRYGVQQMENPPYTWMIPAVLACVCCCWPLGLAAILKASEAESAIKAGNRQQAEASSASARIFTIASVLCGIAINVMLIVFFVLPKADDGVPDY
ncbi:uncharacterized protein [Ptychodera flava]|uniref:uncharacterized protein isoform X2 n=1 Tax=Ptychodera flava TaxID=63121 RepID=UPI00396A59F0